MQRQCTLPPVIAVPTTQPAFLETQSPRSSNNGPYKTYKAQETACTELVQQLVPWPRKVSH